jgi:hypothetical protein
LFTATPAPADPATDEPVPLLESAIAKPPASA